jgi:hypothetical protein
MHKYLKLLFIGLIGLNLVLCSWYVLHKDLYFQTDIARDFLLLQELDHKKIVLLGPRSSTGGLFHGPLWMYLNYPAYIIGQGNPVAVGWYWIGLIILFLATSYIIAKELFTTTTAYLYVLFLSVSLIFEARALFNPHGAFFLLPAFFFFFIRTIETMRLRSLLIFLLITGCIIQFQMAIGIPLLLLSLPPLSYQFIKQKKLKYFFSYFVLLIPLSTFIVFDLLHHFIQLHSVLSYVLGNNLDHKTYGNVWGLIGSRLNLMTSEGIGISRNFASHQNLFASILIALLLFVQIKDKKYKSIYLYFVYFYVGYYILSLINKSGGMLYHYYMPLYPLVFLIFASFITSRYKIIFFFSFLVVYMTNFTVARSFIDSTKTFFGQDQNSWKFLSDMASNVYKGQEKEFGYFIYMPDALAYQPKYALNYEARKHPEHALYFQKKPVTYLIIAPPPPDKIGMEDSWWRINQVHMNNKPVAITNFQNGYKIEKYALTSDEMKIPFDAAIDTGIHFR